MKKYAVRFASVAIGVWVTIALVGMFIEVGIHASNQPSKPDMSKCELVTSADGHNAWYTCPYSLGV